MPGTSNGGMGMRKHGQSGKKTKSPKARHSMKREAEKQEKKAKRSTCNASSMQELLGPNNA